MTYACSICPRNSSIYSNSFSLTKWTNFILLNLSIVAAFSSVAYSICSALSLTLRAARSICNTTVQSLPPLKLKAICSGWNIEKASFNVYSELSISWQNSGVYSDLISWYRSIISIAISTFSIFVFS